MKKSKFYNVVRKINPIYDIEQYTKELKPWVRNSLFMITCLILLFSLGLFFFSIVETSTFIYYEACK